MKKEDLFADKLRRPRIKKGYYSLLYTMDLFAACRAGDLNEVARIISAGGNLSSVDEFGRTPAHYAAADPGPMFKFLVDNGTNLRIKDKSGIVPIHIACKHGLVNNVRLCKNRKGGNASIATNDGITALMYACANGHTDVVYALFPSRRSVNCVGPDGITALSEAIRYGHKDIVEVLDRYGSTGIRPDVLVSHLNADMLRFLMESNIQIPTESLLINLHLSPHRGLVDVLVKCGIDVSRPVFGLTLIGEAVRYKNYALVNELLEAKVDVTIFDKNGCTPLKLAARYKDVDYGVMYKKILAKCDGDIRKLLKITKNVDKIC